jgi:hypothetical protein
MAVESGISEKVGSALSAFHSDDEIVNSKTLETADSLHEETDLVGALLSREEIVGLTL